MDPSFFSAYILPATLALIMMGMGLSLELRDFKNVVRYPRSILIGVICQVLVLPIISFLLFGFSNLSPYYKIGFVVITACAGGAATNLITYLLKGNVALSITLTAFNSLLVLITLPIIVNISLEIFLGTERSIHLPFMDTLINIVLTMIIPTAIGMAIRYQSLKLAQRIEKPLKPILLILLFSVFVVIMFFDNGESNNDFSHYLFLVPHALLLNFVSMLVVYIFARYSSLGGKNNFTLSVEVGLKNSIVGIFVAKTLLGNHDITMVSVIYGSFTFFSTLIFGYLARQFEIGIRLYHKKLKQ